jgi:TonB-linked SusC/RagA family outer membrane protein
MQRKFLQIKAEQFIAVLLITLCVNTAWAQTLSVRGKVTSSDDGSAIPGVNILVKSSTVGTTTDVNGEYTINVPSSNAILVFSFIGYKPFEASVSDQSIINVVLQADIQQLSEVVIVGYGEQKRSDITGAVASVPKDRLQTLPVTNIMYALQGSTPGLNVSQGSSVPGRAASVTIRGTNSINANADPLYVLDGVIFFGSTNDINPSDIESIEVLKDASAVAIYGTRGSNGVILITTKRGKSGKPTFSYNGYTGVEDMAHVLTPMGPDAYVQKYADYKIATNNASTNVLPNLNEINNYNAGLTTDWIKVATQTGKIQEHNLGVRGGNETAKYYVNLGYLNEQGVVKGYEYKRYSVRTNLDVTPTDWLKFGTSLFYVGKNLDGGRVNLLQGTAMSPYSTPYDANGTLLGYPMAPEQLYVNPLLNLNVKRIDRGNNLNGGGYLELAAPWTTVKGLKFRIQGSYSLQFTRLNEFNGKNTFPNSTTPTSANVSGDQTDSWVLENLLMYTKDFNKHHIDFTGLYSAQKNIYFYSKVTSNNVFDDLAYNSLGSGTSFSASSTNPSGVTNYNSALVSQMGRINYSYDSRYMASFTIRRDGFSAFGKDADKYAVFPSAALGWNIHNESFFGSASAISQLKLRFSYGKTGNQAITPYQTFSTANGSTQSMGGSLRSSAILNDLMGNSHLKWESTTQANLGVDFGLFQNRVSGAVDVFQSHTTDCLLKRNIPTASGSTQTWDNLGELQNQGLEIMLKGVALDKGGFKWEINGNFSTFRNKILDLYGDKKSDINNKWFIGEPLGVIYDYKKIGVWQSGETPTWDASAKSGDIKFEDVSGPNGVPDGVIDANDKVVQGRTSPKWYGGLTNTFHYKNFHLNIFFQASIGALKNNVDASYADERGRRNIPAVVGYWTPDNGNNDWPSLGYTNTRGYGYPMDNSFVRLKDVTLSYTFPEALLSKAHLGQLTLYVAARNVHTWTKWIGWDPESNQVPRGSAGDFDNYPYVRTISFGLNLSL